METMPSYPVGLSIDYPDRDLSRLTTFFRIFVAIPIFIILALLTPSGSSGQSDSTHYQYATAGFLFLPTLLMIVFRQKYPRWWYDWNVALVNFTYRVSSFIALQTDVYPSTEDEQNVHITISYPDVTTELNRWLPLVKWFLAIPHYIVLFVLGIAAFVCVIIAWFAILFTGRYPRGLFDFVLGVMRYSLRVTAYAIILVTDKYPPFGLAA